MEASCTLAEEDFVALQRYYVDHPPPGVGWAGRVFVVVPLLIGALGTIILVTGFLTCTEEGEIVLEPLVQGGVVLVVALLFYLFRHPIAALFARRSLRRWGEAKFLGPRQTRLTPEGLASAGDFGASLLSWSGLTSIGVGPHHVFFFLSARQAVIVPKQAFGSEVQFTEFVDTARRYHEAARALR